MSAYTTNASLVIVPNDVNWVPEQIEKLSAFLQERGLTGTQLNEAENSFLVGEKFLDQISFMGCSPNVKLDDENSDGKFTFIRLTSSPEINALIGKHSFAPHCPHCKKPEKNWGERLQKNQIACSNCQMTSDVWKYNWRKSAGFGRCFIEITDIFPKEAIPQSSLLDALEKQFGPSWSYFFYHA